MRGFVGLGIGMLHCLGSVMNEILFHTTVLVDVIITYNILVLFGLQIMLRFGSCDEVIGDGGPSCWTHCLFE